MTFPPDRQLAEELTAALLRAEGAGLAHLGITFLFAALAHRFDHAILSARIK